MNKYFLYKMIFVLLLSYIINCKFYYFILLNLIDTSDLMTLNRQTSSLGKKKGINLIQK